MRQVFINAPLTGGAVSVEGDDYHHLTRSLRLKVGEPLRLVDSASRIWDGEVSAIDRREARVSLLKDLGVAAPLPPLELALCCPAGDALDASLEAATQLGATRIRLLISARSQRPDPAKRDRWVRILRESCCQALRARFPELEGPEPLAEGLVRAQGRKYLAWQGGTALESGPASLEEALALLVGPEGGFEDAEISSARAAGFVPLKLADFVLRVPVAVAAGLARLNPRRNS